MYNPNPDDSWATKMELWSHNEGYTHDVEHIELRNSSPFPTGAA
jgi:hypothetical protein